MPIAAARATRVRSVCPLMPNKSNYNLGREMGEMWPSGKKNRRRRQTKKPYRITFRSSRYPQQPDMMSWPFDLEFVKGLLKIGNGGLVGGG